MVIQIYNHKIKQLSLFMTCFVLAACSSNRNDMNYINNPKVSFLLHNKNSMTYELKKLNKNFTVSVLFSEYQGDSYQRGVLLCLESIPVIAALSYTSVKNKTFYNILSNSAEHPIGLKLFAQNSHIKRNQDMVTTKIKFAQLDNEKLTQYLISLNYSKDQEIARRSSTFYYKNESMQVIEYLLPSIMNFIN